MMPIQPRRRMSMFQRLLVGSVFLVALAVADARRLERDYDNNEVVPACSHGYTRCATGNKCVHDTFFCDGDNDCGDNSDESSAFCRQHVCADGSVRCGNGQCIDAEEFCTEQVFCNDGSLRRNREVCPDAEPSFDLCLDVVINRCARPFSDQWTTSNIGQRIIENSMHDICSSLTGVKRCADDSLAGECHAADASLMPDYYRRFRTDYDAFLDVVCTQEIDVIDQHKACLMGVNSHETDVIAIVETCLESSLQDGHGCGSAWFQGCLIDKVRVYCGMDIATAIYRHREQLTYILTNYLYENCAEVTPQQRRGLHRGLASKKSYGYFFN